MSDQHARFQERLAASWRAVFLVAQKQYAQGRDVEIPGLHIAPSADEAEAYVDGGDLMVVVRHRIEVKHLSINFTGAADWPFRDGVFVSNEAAVNRANGGVYAYVSVSQDFRYCAIIGRRTRPTWRIKECRVNNTGNIERNYICPLEGVVFEKLDNW
jgi:hypothetical protein